MLIRLFLSFLVLLIWFPILAQFNGLIGTTPTSGPDANVTILDLDKEKQFNLCTWDSTYGMMSNENTYDKKNNRYFRLTNKGITVSNANNGKVIKNITLNVFFRGMEYDTTTGLIYGCYEEYGWEKFAAIDPNTDSLIVLDTFNGLSLYTGRSQAMDEVNGIWYRGVQNRVYGIDISTGTIVLSLLMPWPLSGLEIDGRNGVLYFTANLGGFTIFRGFNPITKQFVNRDTLSFLPISSFSPSSFDYIKNQYIIGSNFGVHIIDIVNGIVLDTIPIQSLYRDFEFASVCIASCEPVMDSICEGDSLYLGGAYRKISGIYKDSSKSSYGCDSIYYTNLYIKPFDPSIYVSDSTLIAVDTASYQWINCKDRSLVPNANQKEFTPFEPGWYAAIITKNGCTDTSECIGINVLGVNENSFQELSVYPNPMSDVLIVDVGRISNLNIELLSLNADVILNMRYLGVSMLKMDVSEIAKGIYFLKIRSDEDVQIIKLIKN